MTTPGAARSKMSMVTLELPRGPRYGDFFTVTIQGVAANGRGWADVEAVIGPQKAPRRYRLEVRKAMPGDVIEAMVESRKRHTLEARVHRIVQPSPDRREARCQHFGPREEPGRGCGGCTLQALTYDAQLAAKKTLVQSLLQREVREPVAAASEWFYRNKMEFSFGDDRARDFALGLRPTGWHREVIGLQECFLLDGEVIDLLAPIREWAAEYSLDWLIQLTVRTGKRTGERLFELVTTHSAGPDDADSTVGTGGRPDADQAQLAISAFAAIAEPLADSVWWTQQRAVRGERTSWTSQHLSGTLGFHEELHLPGDRTLRLAVPLKAFFQPNPGTAERLISVIVEGLGTSTDLDLVDLYCGTGTMGLALAPWVRRVVGVEIVPDAVEAARHNAEANGIENAHYLVGDCAKVLDSDEFRALLRADGPPDVVLVDPPRAGLQGKSLELTAGLRAPRIIYVSCGPKALARDLKALALHGYAVESVQPVDMFPQTQHIENVALLRLESP